MVKKQSESINLKENQLIKNYNQAVKDYDHALSNFNNAEKRYIDLAIAQLNTASLQLEIIIKEIKECNITSKNILLKEMCV